MTDEAHRVGGSRQGHRRRVAAEEPEDVKAEMKILQEIIDARARQYPNRLDNGGLNNMVGAADVVFVHGFALNAGTYLENKRREAVNGIADVIARNLPNDREGIARKTAARHLPPVPERPHFRTLEELMPGCNEQATHAVEAMKKDSRLAGWVIKQVTKQSIYGEGLDWIPLSGYHHKAKAVSADKKRQYSVDMHNAREVRPWTANDEKFFK